MSKVTPEQIKVEAALLKAMSNTTHYNKYIEFVDMARLMPNTKLLLTDYAKYYDMFKTIKSIDFGTFYSKFAQVWHKEDLTNLEIDYYRDYVFPAIEAVSIDEEKNCLLSLIQMNFALDLSKATSKDFTADDLEQMITAYRDLEGSVIDTRVHDALSMEGVEFSSLDSRDGIPLFLPSLQAGLGSLVKGQFVVVSADYGTGKSAFVISQAVHAFRWLHQRKDTRPILYFNSEGTAEEIFGRFCSNLYKDKLDGFEEVVLRGDEVKRKFLKAFNAKQFLVFQITVGGINKIIQYANKLNPALIIIDITDTLAPEEDVQNLKKVYDRLRLLSASVCPIIGTTQSGDTSYQDKDTGKIVTRKWLGDKALYGSKAGKGGAATTIITIGKDDNQPGVRYINTPKKKRGTPTKVTCLLVDKFSLYQEVL
jgi:KaiC/GvpD/RAD55 family RecA-like ATPase